MTKSFKFMIIITWLVLCFLVGKFAEKKGYDLWPYALLSVIISPIGGFIVLLLKGDNKEKKSVTPKSSFVDIPTNTPEPAYLQQEDSVEFCPKCGAKVDSGAAFCPKCGNSLK